MAEFPKSSLHCGPCTGRGPKGCLASWWHMQAQQALSPHPLPALRPQEPSFPSHLAPHCRASPLTPLLSLPGNLFSIFLPYPCLSPFCFLPQTLDKRVKT